MSSATIEIKNLGPFNVNVSTTTSNSNVFLSVNHTANVAMSNGSEIMIKF